MPEGVAVRPKLLTKEITYTSAYTVASAISIRNGDGDEEPEDYSQIVAPVGGVDESPEEDRKEYIVKSEQEEDVLFRLVLRPYFRPYHSMVYFLYNPPQSPPRDTQEAQESQQSRGEPEGEEDVVRMRHRPFEVRRVVLLVVEVVRLEVSRTDAEERMVFSNVPCGLPDHHSRCDR